MFLFTCLLVGLVFIYLNIALTCFVRCYNIVINIVYTNRKCYDCRAAHLDGGREAVEKMVLQFKQDFTSRIWITYREGFSKLSGSRLTSDSGWGCMVRASQMILAQAMVTHFLDRDWTMFDEQVSVEFIFSWRCSPVSKV